MSTKDQDQKLPSPPPLAIIGMGCLFPQADSASAFWANIKAGVDAVHDIPETHWQTKDYFHQDPNSPDMTYARRGAFLEPIDFNPLEFGITPNNLEATDTTQLLGLVAAQQALRDAGYATGKETKDGKPFNRDRTSVILGVTGALELVIPLGARLGHPIWRKALSDAGVEKTVAEDVVQRISDSYVPWQENSFPGLLGNVAAGRIANRLDTGGTNCVVDAACGSSLAALHVAAMELYAGKSDMVLTGGLDTFNDIFMYMCFSKTPALSPTGNSRPFDAAADGTILGEGLGIIVLKRLADAQRDGDRIYAVIRSIGTSSDGKGNAVYAPSADGQKRCLLSAYSQAGISPETIELVEAHGTGTKVGDAIEAKALAQVFSPVDVGSQTQAPWCALGSVKSMIGHTKAAAGIAGLIKTTLALKHKVLPPTIKIEQPLEVLTTGQTPLYVNTVKRPWLPSAAHPRRAGISAFGFGGSNFHCVLEEDSATKSAIDWDERTLILPFAAESSEKLQQTLTAFGGTYAQAQQNWAQLRAQAGRLRQAFQPTAPYRLVLVAQKNQSDLAKQIQNALRMLQKHPERNTWNTPDGVYFGTQTPGQLGILFPGQGSQYVGMLRDLACQFPQMLETLTEANLAFGTTQHGTRLSDLIYPIPAFSDAARKSAEQTLNSTQNAQPALGAVGLGAWRILSHFGLQPQAAAGHSFGELLALCAAGTLSSTHLHHLACVRGQAMANAAPTPLAGQPRTDAGTMLAVIAPSAEVEKILADHKLQLVIANKNAPAQVVLSGATGEIERAATILNGLKIRNKRLSVSAAFHSPLVSEAQKPFATALQQITMSPGTMPVYSNTTARVYPTAGTQAAQLLAGQLAHPVEFVQEIENMYAAGIRTFVEVGPGGKITGLVHAILHDRAHEAFALDASSGKRENSGTYDLACTLAQLAALGYPIQLTKWDETFAAAHLEIETKKPAMTVRLSGANYVKPRTATAPTLPRPKAVSTPSVNGTLKSKPEESAPVNQTPPPPSSFPATSTLPAAQVTPITLPAGAGNLTHALQATQQSILLLQKMQEQTAQLHHQYLQGQEAAQRSIQQLIEQQMSLLSGAPLQRTASLQPILATAVIPTVAAPIPTAQPSPVIATPAPVNALSVTVPKTAADSQAQTVLLEVIAEKTGYPVEMLNLEMSLDADLGIDSIKRVEILSALQIRLPEAPVVKPDDLGRLQTLQQIVAFLTAGNPQVSATPAARIESPAIQPTTASNGQEQTVLLEVIAEKTGYPVEMLNLEMSLDADLGIDSIKRVEILSALQTRLPAAPIVKPDDLGRLQTLQQIVNFLQVSPAQGAAPTAVPAPLAATHNAQTVLLEVIAEKTGYPVEMLNLEMSLDADLGIDSIKRVEILSALQTRMPEAPIVKPDDLGRLQTLQQIVNFLQTSVAPAVQKVEPPTTTPAKQTTKPHGHKNTPDLLDRQVLTIVPLHEKTNRQNLDLPGKTLIWVTDDGAGLAQRICQSLKARHLDAQVVALDATPTQEKLAGLLILAPAKPIADFIQKAFGLIQRTGPLLREAGKHGVAFLASASMMDGCFALNGHTPRHPLTGGLAGLVKTASHEWPEVTCKSLDLADEGHDADQLAGQIADELLLKGPAEVGITNAGRMEPRLIRQALNGEVGKVAFHRNDVIVVTGGARGVTAAVSIALAKAYHCKLLLLGRSPLPQAEPAWLAGSSTEAQIKKALSQNLKGTVTPRVLDEKYRQILAGREVQATLQTIQAAGAQAIYKALDVRDIKAVTEALTEARRDLGPIRGIIHGAGVLQDRLIEHKTAAQFDEVFSTKVGGFNALLHAAQGDELKVIVAFSSSTGRFGRKGQIAYAAANEVLNKLAQKEAHQRPKCRVLSMNWGPWEGGMVTPQLRKIFENEGVGLIPLQAGADYLVREMSTPAGGPVEIVILGPTPRAPEPTKHKNGAASKTAAPLTVACERQLSTSDYPFLQSHVLKGKAVLPMAMIIEWLAHGAMHENPGLLFQGFEDLRICKGVSLNPQEKLSLQVLTGPPVSREGAELVPVELRSGEILHARANILLTTRLTPGKAQLVVQAAQPYPLSLSDIYQTDHLFHGPALQGIQAIEGWSDEGIIGRAAAAPAPTAWMRQPLRASWLTDPLALDVSFQMMILWCIESRGLASLPTSVQHYRQYASSFPAQGTRIVIRVVQASEHFAEARIEFLDLAGNLIASMDGYECVLDTTLQNSFAHNQLVG